jgi:glutamate dehydrogenase/leucine dehydrogenase
VANPFEFTDELGPEKVIELYDPATSLHAILVVDNVAMGPSIGGLRMATDVTVEECFRLARAMTLKNAAAGLPHGGGKAVIIADPNMPRADKERIIRAFAYAIQNIEDYIVGPDMGTDETAMAWVHDVIHRCVGLPREIGGIPLDEIGATGFGLAAALDVAQAFHDFEVDGARVVVQGFGSVGQHAARFLCRRGARLVGVSDSRGSRANPDGFDVDALIAFKNAGQGVAEFEQGDALERDAVIDIESEIWIPAARPDVLRADNIDRLNTKVVAEGANIPATLEAEEMLAERGILVIPDFIANAGGVICAAVEYAGGTQTQALSAIDEKIRANTREVLSTAKQTGKLPRDVAAALARKRVIRAMEFRQTF